MAIKAIIFDWVGTLYKRNTGLFDGTTEILRQLESQYKLGLVSLAGQGIEQRVKDIEQTGISKYFSSIVVDTKKKEEQFLQCMRQLDVTPKETAVVGDRTRREIQIGNRLGCQTYWIKKGDYAYEGPTIQTGQPQQTITSLQELLMYL